MSKSWVLNSTNFIADLKLFISSIEEAKQLTGHLLLYSSGEQGDIMLIGSFWHRFPEFYYLGDEPYLDWQIVNWVLCDMHVT